MKKICKNCNHFDKCVRVYNLYSCCIDYEAKPLTEQEYLQTCNTEQLAEWLQEHMDCIGCPASCEKCHRYYDACKEVMMVWLKQPHKE